MWWQQKLSEFVTLFLVINPFGLLPVFLSIAGTHTSSLAAQARARGGGDLVRRAGLFHLCRRLLLDEMGISIRAFQISGGILLFLVALEMIRSRSLTRRAGLAKQGDMALAVYPLAIPKIAGPGSMLTVVLLTDDDRFNPLGS